MLNLSPVRFSSCTKSIANPLSFSSVAAVLALSMEKKISSSGQGGHPPKYGPADLSASTGSAVLLRSGRRN
jgi:hypothetical protein